MKSARRTHGSTSASRLCLCEDIRRLGCTGFIILFQLLKFLETGAKQIISMVRGRAMASVIVFPPSASVSLNARQRDGGA